jgi:hypothetical protein
MALSQPEIERCRYHLGYPEVQPAASIQFGIPRPIQTAFLFESAVTLLVPYAEDRVRRYINIMDGIETKLIAGQDRLAADKLDDLTLRSDELERLEDEYRRWGYRLADILGVPVYAYSMRYRTVGGPGRAGSIPTRNG